MFFARRPSRLPSVNPRRHTRSVPTGQRCGPPVTPRGGLFAVASGRLRPVAVDAVDGFRLAVAADRRIGRRTSLADRDGSRPQQENGDGKQRREQ